MGVRQAAMTSDVGQPGLNRIWTKLAHSSQPAVMMGPSSRARERH
jgi:hypothetical protein